MAGIPSNIALASLDPVIVKGNISPIVASSPELRDGTRPTNNPPGAPDFTLSAGGTTITATITDGKGADSYQIRLEGEASTDGQTLSGLNPGTTYSVQVRGVNQYGTGTWSSSVSQETESGSPVESFTPLLTRDFAGTTIGQATAVPDGWSKGDYVDTPTKSGNRALRLRRAVTETGSCPYGSGAQQYGGRFNLPEEVPVGNIIWMRFYVYFPPGFSFGYLYSSSDDSELDACGIGGGADGNNNTKFMVLAPSAGTARTYVNLPAIRRAVSHPSPFLRIDTEAANGENLDFSYEPKFAQWCAFQVAMKVASDNTGWIRLWVDDEFIGETTGHPTVSGSGNTIAEWGIGDYWNGYPWTDGVGDRGPFYLDEVIIATDMPGYGAPTGVDSEGRVYIDPNTTVGGLS